MLGIVKIGFLELFAPSAPSRDPPALCLRVARITSLSRRHPADFVFWSKCFLNKCHWPWVLDLGFGSVFTLSFSLRENSNLNHLQLLVQVGPYLWVWWYTLVIPALGRLREKEQKLQGSLATWWDLLSKNVECVSISYGPKWRNPNEHIVSRGSPLCAAVG
jgi:hypothetical protein